MGLLVRLRRALAEPRLSAVDIDSLDRIEVHRRILSEKPMLREVFGEIYALCRALDERFLTGAGARVELGAGTSLLKRDVPEALASDVEPAAGLDLVLDAHAMGLADASVRCFYGIHCFHHFHAPSRFFAELQRTLVPGGGCVLVEPYHGPLAAAFYKRVFDTEHFDKRQPGWEREGRAAMSDANQALSYIVFRRDAGRFRAEHPDLELVHEQRLANAWRYLLSGGLNFRQLAPSALAPLIRAVETLQRPVDHLLALHHVIVLRKRPAP